MVQNHKCLLDPAVCIELPSPVNYESCVSWICSKLYFHAYCI